MSGEVKMITGNCNTCHREVMWDSEQVRGAIPCPFGDCSGVVVKEGEKHDSVVVHFGPAYEPHYAGPALCLGCGDEWMAVVPLGTFELECAECKTLRGIFKHPFVADGLTMVWTCRTENCGSEYVSILRRVDGSTSVRCAKCGSLAPAEELFLATD